MKQLAEGRREILSYNNYIADHVKSFLAPLDHSGEQNWSVTGHSFGSYIHNSIILNDWGGSDSPVYFGEGQAHDRQAAPSSPLEEAIRPRR